MRPQGGGKEASVTRYRRVKCEGHALARADGCQYEHRVALYDDIGPGEHPCHWCGRELTWFGPGPRIVADHLDDDRWNNEPRNLVPSCRYCNSARARRPDWLTHCEAGHPWYPDTTYLRRDGGRQCRLCNRRRDTNRRDRRRVRVEAIQPVGRVGEAEYAVASVTGGDDAHCRKPCSTCPWRTDVAAGVFPAEAFRVSAPTAYDMSLRLFACHMAKPERPRTCAGFLLRGAVHNLSVRLQLAQGRIDPRQVSDGGYPLHADYRAMAEANGVAADDPVLGPCR